MKDRLGCADNEDEATIRVEKGLKMEISTIHLGIINALENYV